jgi:hypothetical protein
MTLPPDTVDRTAARSRSPSLSRYPLGRIDVNGMKSFLSMLDVKTNCIYCAVGAGKRSRD